MQYYEFEVMDYKGGELTNYKPVDPCELLFSVQIHTSVHNMLFQHAVDAGVNLDTVSEGAVLNAYFITLTSAEQDILLNKVRTLVINNPYNTTYAGKEGFVHYYFKVENDEIYDACIEEIIEDLCFKDIITFIDNL